MIGEVPLTEAAQTLAHEVAQLPHEARESAVAAFERVHPDDFAALYRAVADAYYATPQVAAILAARASSGPQEPAPFDPRLLTGVIKEQRGKRRL